jgi:membrane dipeptidase
MNPKNNKTADQIHRDAIVFDGLLMWNNLDGRAVIEDMLLGNITSANYTLAHGGHNFEGALDEIIKYRRIIEENSDLLDLVLTAADIEKAKAGGKLGVVFGFQDSGPVERIDQIDLFYALGVRIIQLTYNVQNSAGTGCCDISGGEITYFGRELIRKMEKRGIALDLSHCGDETTDSALEFAERPVLFTHVGVRELCNAQGRGKTDRQFELLARTGGVAGICFLPALVKRDPDTYEVLPSNVKDVVDAIDYVVKLIGIDHVGFGSDLAQYWYDMGRRPGDSPIAMWRERRPDVFGRGPTEVSEPFPVGLQRFSEFSNLTAELVERGYGEDAIHKILGGNFLRVLREIWGE